MRPLVVSCLLMSLFGLACNLELSGSVDDLEGEATTPGGRGGPLEPSVGIGGGTQAAPVDAPPVVCDWDVLGGRSVGTAQGGAGGEGGAGAPGSGSDGAELGTGDLTVLLVFDKSGSMGFPWELGTRWQAASEAFLKGLEGVESEVTVGAIVFPVEEQCDVPPIEHESQIQFQSGTEFVERWSSTAAESVPRGGTPLGLAFHQADAAIRKAEVCGLLEGRFRVVVVTDGEPNCGTNENSLVGYAQSWRSKGVEVHVMGLPGSDAAASLLDRIAGVGGTDEHVPTESVHDAEDKFWHVVR